jgi:protein SCO1/2
MLRVSHLALLLFAALAFVVDAGGGSVVSVAAAQSAKDAPLSPEMRVIDVDERRGRRLDRDLRLVDHTGRSVTVGDFVDGERPVLLTMNYYRCRIVCSVQLNGLAAALSELDWTPGDENFRVVTVSIDPKETPSDAAKKRETILASLGRGDDVDWQFLTTDALTIQAIAAQLGIGYAYDAEQDQYAHPAVAMFITPDGEIAQYVYGLTFDVRDIKLALLDAGQGKIGSPMEKLYQSCFSYDPSIGRYGPWAFGIMRIGGTLTFVILTVVIVILWRRDRRRTRELADPTGHAEAVS